MGHSLVRRLLRRVTPPLMPVKKEGPAAGTFNCAGIAAVGWQQAPREPLCLTVS